MFKGPLSRPLTGPSSQPQLISMSLTVLTIHIQSSRVSFSVITKYWLSRSSTGPIHAESNISNGVSVIFATCIFSIQKETSVIIYIIETALITLLISLRIYSYEFIMLTGNQKIPYGYILTAKFLTRNFYSYTHDHKRLLGFFRCCKYEFKFKQL